MWLGEENHLKPAVDIPDGGIIKGHKLTVLTMVKENVLVINEWIGNLNWETGIKKKIIETKNILGWKNIFEIKKKITEHNGIMEITKKRVSEPEDGYIEITQFEKDE